MRHPSILPIPNFEIFDSSLHEHSASSHSIPLGPSCRLCILLCLPCTHEFSCVFVQGFWEKVQISLAACKQGDSPPHYPRYCEQMIYSQLLVNAELNREVSGMGSRHKKPNFDTRGLESLRVGLSSFSKGFLRQALFIFGVFAVFENLFSYLPSSPTEQFTRAIHLVSDD